MQSGEPRRLFGIEPPRPKIEASRTVDMSGSNAGAEFASMPAALSWPTRATLPEPCRPISGTRTPSTRFAIPRFHPPRSRASGGFDPAPKHSFALRPREGKNSICDPLFLNGEAAASSASKDVSAVTRVDRLGGKFIVHLDRIPRRQTTLSKLLRGRGRRTMLRNTRHKAPAAPHSSSDRHRVS